MPSTMSTSVSSDLFSSTVMTPSLPTFCIACAIILPIAASPLAEIVPICATSEEEATGLARFSISLTTANTAISMPRLRSIGFMPAATDLAPSRTIACASTVAVVVPSPAVSLVLEATSRSICAPMFSNLSSSSISLATVTPSLVMRGAPKLFSMTTLRPLGPSVTFTALARISTPRSMRSRASPENLTSLAAIFVAPEDDPHPGLTALPRSPEERAFARVPMDERVNVNRDIARPFRAKQRCALAQHAHDVGFLHDQEFLAVELDLGARPLAEQHAVAALDIDRDQLAGFIAAARPDRHYLPLLGLFLGTVGNNDAALGLFLSVDTLDYDTVMQGTKFGFSHDSSFWKLQFSGLVQVWFAIESGLRIRAHPAPSTARTFRILSNRALGVLITRPG